MTMLRASEFFRTHDENALLNELKTHSLTTRMDLVQESSNRFREQAEIAIEVRCIQRKNHFSRENFAHLVKQTSSTYQFL